MTAIADRFRRWYEHERDSNAKTLAMLASVPADKHADPLYQKALDKMAHLVAARTRWLHRLGRWPTLPDIFPVGSLDTLPAKVAEIEAAWVAYLAPLDDAALAMSIEWSFNGKHLKWDLESLLTQVNGHAWYHRGQIATLVGLLGGKPVDTDYIFFHKPETLAG